jgi:glycerol-3-phosphate cytidylyltransferase-like family protein
VRPGALAAGLIASLLLVGAACRDGDDGDLEAYCGRLEQVRRLDAAAFTVDLGDDIAVAGSRQELVTTLAEAAEVAPSQVRDEVTTLARYMAAVDEVLTNQSDDAFDDAGALDRATADLGDVDEAARRVVQHASAACDIRLDAGSG